MHEGKQPSNELQPSPETIRDLYLFENKAENRQTNNSNSILSDILEYFQLQFLPLKYGLEYTSRRTHRANLLFLWV